MQRPDPFELASSALRGMELAKDGKLDDYGRSHEDYWQASALTAPPKELRRIRVARAQEAMSARVEIGRSLVMAFQSAHKRPAAPPAIFSTRPKRAGERTQKGQQSFRGAVTPAALNADGSPPRPAAGFKANETPEPDYSDFKFVSSADPAYINVHRSAPDPGAVRRLDPSQTLGPAQPLPAGTLPATGTGPRQQTSLPLPPKMPAFAAPPKTCVRDAAVESPRARVATELIDLALDEYFNDDGSLTPRTAHDPPPEARPAIGATVSRHYTPAELQPGKCGASPMAVSGGTPQKPRGQVQLGGLNLKGRVPSFGRAKSGTTPQKPNYQPL